MGQAPDRMAQVCRPVVAPQLSVAARLAKDAIEKDKVVLVVCSSLGCRGPGEQLRVPTVLTASGALLPGTDHMTFLINAPGPDDLTKQTMLARDVVNEALSRSREPTAEGITAALRGMNLTASEGSVSFDKSGNNFGPVAFRRAPLSCPSCAGCTDKCEKACTSENLSQALQKPPPQTGQPAPAPAPAQGPRDQK